jgi:hypothetical protein
VDNSDLAVILLLLMLVMAAYLFPGGPGTPLRMRAGLEAYPTG